MLRQTILASKMPMKALERETGVQRLSIVRFLRGSQSLRLDKADKLATYFGLALQPIQSKKGR
jgi:plasmid maintenance system antidote protein VapI